VYESLKGNKHATKEYPRDGKLHCRFNKKLIELMNAKRGNLSQADYLEMLVLSDLAKDAT